MRLRNVKNANKIIEECSYVIKNPKQFKGKYHEVFNNKNEIKIEIGMGKGAFIKNNALRYPHINFIGIEKFDSVLVRAIQKIDVELPNLKLIKIDALEIDEVFDKEINTIYLNFSDPWPKKRHQERRLTSPTFLKKYDLIYKNNPHIIFKTDNRHLFEYSLVSLNEQNYKIEAISLNLKEDNVKDNIGTEYETKFNLLGQPIYMVEVKR